MTVEYHILNKNGLLTEPEKTSILETVKESVSEVESFLGDQNIDVVIKSVKGACSKDLHIRGCALEDACTVYITLDPQYTNCTDANWLKELGKTVAHEFHHCKRWQKVGYGNYLKATLVSEGLAQVFEIDTGHGISNYATALTNDELIEVSRRARAYIFQNEDHAHVSQNKDYDHPLWFYGKDPKQFKRWSGYSLGFAIVSRWLEDNGKTAAEAVGIPTDEILRPWLERGEEYLLPRQTTKSELRENSPNRPAAPNTVVTNIEPPV